MGENQESECGVIPAGTRVSIFGSYLTLKHDTQVHQSQEKVNEDLARRAAYKNNGNLIFSEDLKNKLASEHP